MMYCTVLYCPVLYCTLLYFTVLYYMSPFPYAAIAHLVKHNQAKFRALANMGDVLIKMNNLEEAIKVYQKQLTLSKQLQDKVGDMY